MSWIRGVSNVPLPSVRVGKTAATGRGTSTQLTAWQPAAGAGTGPSRNEATVVDRPGSSPVMVTTSKTVPPGAVRLVDARVVISKGGGSTRGSTSTVSDGSPGGRVTGGPVADASTAV